MTVLVGQRAEMSQQVGEVHDRLAGGISLGRLLGLRRRRGLGLGDRRACSARAAAMLGVVEQQRRSALAANATRHDRRACARKMWARTRSAVQWQDQADLEIDRLRHLEGALHPGQILVGLRPSHRRRAPRRQRWCARHRRAVEPGLARDAVALAPINQLRLADLDLEMLGHLVLADHHAIGAAGSSAVAKQQQGVALGAHTRAAMRARSRSVAVSRASRFRARSSASSGLRQTISRSPGKLFGQPRSRPGHARRTTTAAAGPSSLASF